MAKSKSKPPMRVTPKAVRKTRTNEPSDPVVIDYPENRTLLKEEFAKIADRPGFAESVEMAKEVIRGSKGKRKQPEAVVSRNITKNGCERPPQDCVEALGDALGIKGLRRVDSDDPTEMLGPLVDPIIDEEDDEDDQPRRGDAS